MPRPLWKGGIAFGLVHVPVALYPASRSESLGLDMLDKRDFAPIGYRRINKNTSKEVSRENIVKGYEYEKGEYVVLSDEDFRLANVKATQTVEIVSFVDADAIEPYYFDTPYYLEPGKRAEKGYALLREVLRSTGRVGIARVVIRSRQHLAALVPLEKVLLLNTLRYAHEIRSMSNLALPEARTADVSDKELAMAKRLVDDMTEKWKPRQYKDTYHDDLMALIEKKVKSGKTHLITPEVKEESEPRRSAEVIDLVSLLKRSLEKKGRLASEDEEGRERPKRAAARKSPSRSSTKKTAHRKRA